MKQYVTDRDVFSYYKKLLDKGIQPNPKSAAEALGVSVHTVQTKVRNLCADGKLIRRRHRLYLKTQDILLDQRKISSEETNRKKAEAGRAGAEALKIRSLETGISRFNPGLGKDESKIAANIERVVRKAEENGTLYHPRPVWVVLAGEKVG